MIATKELISDSRNGGKSIGHDFAFPRREDRESVRRGEIGKI
jgi:hypothetical protein